MGLALTHFATSLERGARSRRGRRRGVMAVELEETCQSASKFDRGKLMTRSRSIPTFLKLQLVSIRRSSRSSTTSYARRLFCRPEKHSSARGATVR
jgi:hypothetical protein